MAPTHNDAESAAPLPPSVLIVDQSEDSREVLRTILGRRGVRIWEAQDGSCGLALARDHHPRVIVLDVDAVAGPACGDDAADDYDLCDEYAQQADQDRTSLVLLGTARRPGDAAREFIKKPYHYGGLIRKIEELLAESAAAESAPVARGGARALDDAA